MTVSTISDPGDPVVATSFGGNTTITLGGTAQYLFNQATLEGGFAVWNPDPQNDLWISVSGVAVANGSGSIRLVANGGGYETPAGVRPYGPVSVVGGVTSQPVTAIGW